MIEGVGPDAPTTINQRGGRQSSVPFRCDLLPARALLAVSRVLKEGAEKYGEDNWKRIDVGDHINHALMHLLAHMGGDTTEEHFTHAACRILFALHLWAEAEDLRVRE